MGEVVKFQEIVTVKYKCKINIVPPHDVHVKEREVTSTITEESDASLDETNAEKVEEKILTELALILYPSSTTRCSDSILELNKMTRHRIENMNGNIDGSHIFVFPFVHGAVGACEIVMSDSDESPSATFDYTSKHGNTCIIHRGREGSETLTGDPGSGTASMLLGGHLQDGDHARMGCCDPPKNLQFFTTVIGKDNKQSIISRDYGKDPNLFQYLRGTLVIEINQSTSAEGAEREMTRDIIYYILVRPNRPGIRRAAVANTDYLIGTFEPPEYNMKELLEALDTHIGGKVAPVSAQLSAPVSAQLSAPVSAQLSAPVSAQHQFHKTICLSNCATFNYKFPDDSLKKLIDTLKMHLCVHAMFCVYVMKKKLKQEPLKLPNLMDSVDGNKYVPVLTKKNTSTGPASEYYQCNSLNRGADKGLSLQTRQVLNDLKSCKQDLVSLLKMLQRTQASETARPRKRKEMNDQTQEEEEKDQMDQFWKNIHLDTKKKQLDWNSYGRVAEQKFCEAVYNDVYKNIPMDDANNILQHLLIFHRFQPPARYAIPPFSYSDLSQVSNAPVNVGGGEKNKKTRKRIRKRRTKKQRKAKRKTRKRRKRKRSRK